MPVNTNSVSRPEVERAIRNIIVATLMLDTTPEALDGNQTEFITALGATSIDALEIIISVEERLHFEFDDDELSPELLRTLDHFVSAVCSKLGVTSEANFE